MRFILNKFQHAQGRGQGHAPSGELGPCGQNTDWWTRHYWKHYLLAISLAGGIKFFCWTLFKITKRLMIEKIIQGFWQPITPFIPTNKQFRSEKLTLCFGIVRPQVSRDCLLVIPELKIETLSIGISLQQNQNTTGASCKCSRANHSIF